MKDKEEYLGYSDDPMGHLLILEQYRDKGSSPAWDGHGDQGIRPLNNENLDHPTT